MYSDEYKIVTLPVSTTYLILGMVREVSATLVATTHRRQPSGGGEKTYTQTSEKCITIERHSRTEITDKNNCVHTSSGLVFL